MTTNVFLFNTTLLRVSQLLLLEPNFLVPFGFFTKQKKGIGKSHFKVTGRPDKTCIFDSERKLLVSQSYNGPH